MKINHSGIGGCGAVARLRRRGRRRRRHWWPHVPFSLSWRLLGADSGTRAASRTPPPRYATASLSCRRHSRRALEAARCMPACIVSWSGRRMLTGRGRSLQRFWLTLLYKATASKIHKLRMFSSSEIFTDYRRLLRGNRRRPLTAVLWPDLEW